MNRLRDLVSIVFGIALALLFCEGALRLGGYKGEASFFTKEAHRAFHLRPHSEGWQSSEGESYVRVNSSGYNDRDHTLNRPPGTIRIAFLGSSETEALQVPQVQNFVNLTERDLNRKLTAKKVETLNFGVEGYNLAQIYYTLHDEIWKYDPQIVLVCFSNFLALKNTPGLAPDAPEKTRYLVFNSNGEPEFEASSKAAIAALPSPGKQHLRDRLADILNASALLTLTNHSLIALSKSVNETVAKLRESTSPKAEASNVPDDYLQWWSFMNPEAPNAPRDPRLLKSFRIGDQIIRKMAQEARARGVEFHIVLLDQPMQTNPDRARRTAFMKDHHLDTLDAADLRLMEFCRKENISAYMLKDYTGPLTPPGVAIRGFGDRMGEGHYNPTGHQILAQALTTLLLRDSPLLRQAAQ